MSLPTPTLHTARLLLRPFTEADTDAIFALHSSPRVLRYWDAPPWSERGRAERFIAVCKQMESEGSGARLAIERAADRVCARGHAARRLHRGWRGVGLLGVWAAQAALEAPAATIGRGLMW